MAFWVTFGTQLALLHADADAAVPRIRSWYCGHIHRIVDELDRLQVPDEDDYQLNALEQIEACLCLAAFEDREAIDKTTKIPGRVCLFQSEALRYSDGRAVTTTIFWDDGWATYVWHPDPAHSRNQPGQVIDMDDVRGPCNRRLVVSSYGFIDTIPADEAQEPSESG